MEQLIADILAFAAEHDRLEPRDVERIIAVHNRGARTPQRRFAKKMIWPTYCKVRDSQGGFPDTWPVTQRTEQLLAAACQMKPRRTASGVATVTVLTRPAACRGNCLFCPSDVRMPKSYLHDEPACQRAERNCFDPYLQVASRLRALDAMGDPCDKVELIVLGGTFEDYSVDYQIWFVHELFRALNEAFSDDARAHASERRDAYRSIGISGDACEIERNCAAMQAKVDAGTASFGEAIEALYGAGTSWQDACAFQHATWQQLEAQHSANENARTRCVGLVVETRPDCVDASSLMRLRRLGCTKVQIGVQTLDTDALTACGRPTSEADVVSTFELLRAFGFKSHVHFMANLPGHTPEQDARDYRRLVKEAPYQPDEVKLYPCMLVGARGLRLLREEGLWQPYAQDVLVDLLAQDVLATPTFTRISRMIRDFSADSIEAGCTKANLRQEVEAEVRKRCEREGLHVAEMRMREVSTGAPDEETLHLDEVAYETSNTREVFLQWIDGTNTLAGFLRLSLPHPSYMRAHARELPASEGQAMIREVHVYGRVASLAEARQEGPDSPAAQASKGGADRKAQHTGLGRALVHRACEIAREAGYDSINVISAVGTRPYYRSLGFEDAGLYQQRRLREGI